MHYSWWNLGQPVFVSSIPLVLENSPHGKAWDFKRFLDARKFYIFEGKAYLRDSIGNITWAAIMKSYGWPEELAKAGAGAFQIYDDWTSPTFNWRDFLEKVRSSYGDDPRDTEAIGLGYRWGGGK